MWSLSAITAFIPSMIRESSPPDAIFPSGFNASPGFVDMTNSGKSIPFAVKSGSFSNSISNATSRKFRSTSASFIAFVSFFASLLRIFDTSSEISANSCVFALSFSFKVLR